MVGYCFVAGVWRELTGHASPPEPDMARLPSWLLIVFNGFLVVLALAVLALAVLAGMVAR